MTTDESLRSASAGAALEVSLRPDTPAVQPRILTGTKKSRPRATMTPLRYPGSKAKMLPALRQLVEGNIPRPELFVEPFVGGGSVSLGMLALDVVDVALVGDADPLLNAFWYEAAVSGPRLVQDMHDEPVTLERFDYWRARKSASRRERALQCLYLNRTSYSGIIGGSSVGPIGGRTQASQYKIDCRFNKDALADQILNIHRLHQDGRLIVSPREVSWQETIASIVDVMPDSDSPEESTLLFLDPPYVAKAARIYGHSFREDDHRSLACALLDSPYRWILTYDAEPIVLDLYRGQGGVSEYAPVHHYSMHGAGRATAVPGREVLFTNLPDDPTFVTDRGDAPWV